MIIYTDWRCDNIILRRNGNDERQCLHLSYLSTMTNRDVNILKASDIIIIIIYRLIFNLIIII